MADDYTNNQADAFNITLPNLGSSIQRSELTQLRKYDARQPKALYQARPGEDSFVGEQKIDTKMHHALAKLIETNFDQTPTQTVFTYEGATNWSKVHLNMVMLPSGFASTKYMIMGNPTGKVDVIAHGSNEVYKQLAIDMMHCSLV